MTTYPSIKLQNKNTSYRIWLHSNICTTLNREFPDFVTPKTSFDASVDLLTSNCSHGVDQIEETSDYSTARIKMNIHILINKLPQKNWRGVPITLQKFFCYDQKGWCGKLITEGKSAGFSERTCPVLFHPNQIRLFSFIAWILFLPCIFLATFLRLKQSIWRTGKSCPQTSCHNYTICLCSLSPLSYIIEYPT